MGQCARFSITAHCFITLNLPCLVLLRGPGSHNCDDKRWEVSAEPAGADLTEVAAAHDSEHDQFSRGEDTWGGEIIARGANRLMLSTGAFR